VVKFAKSLIKSILQNKRWIHQKHQGQKPGKSARGGGVLGSTRGKYPTKVPVVGEESWNLFEFAGRNNRVFERLWIKALFAPIRWIIVTGLVYLLAMRELAQHLALG
jgi:hypothetical protein